MSKRTSILLPDELYELLQRRARQHSTTVSEEIRQGLERDCEDENPNQWLLDLADAFKDVEWKPGPSASDPAFKSWIREGSVAPACYVIRRVEPRGDCSSLGDDRGGSVLPR